MTRKKKITIQQVAHLAGVSSTTVSLVINGPGSGAERISPRTRQRVMDAVAHLNYFPDQTARSLRRRKTERVCLAFSNLGIPHNNILAQQVFQKANEMDYMTIIALMDTPEQEHKTLNQMMRGLADGVIFLTPVSLTNEEVTRLAQLGCAVCVYSNHLLPEGVDVVQTGEGEAAHTALRYLYERGHRQIAYIGNSSTGEVVFPRFQAYVQFMAECALPVEEGYIQFHAGVSAEDAYDKGRRLLALARPPSAIFAGSDLAAIHVMNAIREKGLRIPEDVAVIGSGNLPEGAFTRPPLSTIGPQKIDFGPMVNFLFSRLRGEAAPERRMHRIEWKLILRESA